MTSGIYEIRNSENGHRYIGQALNMTARLGNHRSCLRRGVHANIHLQRAWRKYGANAFSFRKLIICGRENLLMYEQICIDNLTPEYNIHRAAASPAGVVRSQEVKDNISKSKLGKKRGVFSQEWKAKMALAKRGRSLSDSHRAAISRGLLGNKNCAGYKHTEEMRKKMRGNKNAAKK